MTSLGADPKQAFLGARAAMDAILDREAPDAVGEAVGKAVDGQVTLPPPDGHAVMWNWTYQREYVRQREAGADAEKAHAAAAAAHAEDEKRVGRIHVDVPVDASFTCIQGHRFGFMGARTNPCPVCGSPSIQLVKSVRRQALRGFAWAIPLAVGIPLAAVLVGWINPIEVPGILALVAAFAWLGGVVNVLYSAYLLLRPVAAARSRLTRPG